MGEAFLPFQDRAVKRKVFPRNRGAGAKGLVALPWGFMYILNSKFEVGWRDGSVGKVLT